MGFYLVPYFQPSPPTRFLLITAIGICHFLPVHQFGMACLAGSKVNIQQLSRSHNRASMGPSRGCWNGTTSALQPEEITLKGTSFMCVLSIKVPIRKKSGNFFNDPRNTKLQKKWVIAIENNSNRYEVRLKMDILQREITSIRVATAIILKRSLYIYLYIYIKLLYIYIYIYIYGRK